MSHLLAVIKFPRLDPDALRAGSLHIRWYGVSYLLGFALAFEALRRMSRRGVLRLPVALVGELVPWLAIGVMLGGRIGWWLFYHRSEGAIERWYEPLAIWHGGMSFHGGFLGVVGALLMWSWKTRAPFWNLADCLALVAPLGLFFGRVANFINAELVGRPTSLPWGVILPGESIPRHPSQLYEALLEGPVLLLVLWTFFYLARPRDGRVAALFLVVYGVFRFSVEFTREPDPQLGFIAFGWLTMGQMLSVFLAPAGALLWLALGSRTKRRSQDNADISSPSVAAAHASRSRFQSSG